MDVLLMNREQLDPAANPYVRGKTAEPMIAALVEMPEIGKRPSEFA